MTLRKPLRFVFAALLLASLGIVMAQQQPTPPPPTNAPQVNPPANPPADVPQANGTPWQAHAKPAPKFEAVAAGKPLDVKITGPFVHDNLSIFLLHGPDQIKMGKYVMLAEAMEKKLFVIHETQSVNTLQMENLSPDTEVIILSGDIFKGGQQDRFAQFDSIVPPKSGKLPLPAYCVERTAARWMAKIDESNGKFEASPGQVVSQDQKLAGRFYNDQSKVWTEVENAQRNLTMNAGVNVKAAKSDSSLALSLDIKEVVAARDKYVMKLQPAVGGQTNVVGYAYAINGKVYAADVFGSNELFNRVWPRLIRANAVEAFSELAKDKKFEPTSVKSVEDFLKSADAAKAQGRPIDDKGKLREVMSNDEKARILRFETQSDRQQDSFLRRNYLKY